MTTLTAPQRAATIRAAKDHAVTVTTAVRARDQRAIDRLAAELTPQQLWAVVITLAETVNANQLRTLAAVPDDGLPIAEDDLP